VSALGVLAELFEWAERGKFYRDHWEDKDAASVPHMLARQAEDHPALTSSSSMSN
jgi:hypothetical protein